jgi:hypothetical protein
MYHTKHFLNKAFDPDYEKSRKKGSEGKMDTKPF